MNNESDFNIEKKRRIGDLQIQIDAIKSGQMIETLQLQMAIAQSQTFESSQFDPRFPGANIANPKNRHFICN